MATFKMAPIEGEPKRLWIRRPMFTQRYEIVLDGHEIGRFDQKADAVQGQTFSLPEGGRRSRCG